MTAFVRVIPEEVALHGAAAAIVLAHIRFRCASDGPGRFELDGHRWWRVSHQALGREVGLSRKSVMAALKSLSGVVLAKHFPPLDKPERAYRIASDSDALTSQSPKRDSPDQPESQNGQGGVPNGTDPCPDRDSVPLSGELEEGWENACAAEDEPLDAEIVPDPANDPPPQNQLAKQTDPAEAWVDAEIIDDDPDPEPQRYCDRHMPNGTDNSCGACGRRRRTHEAWVQRQQAVTLREIFSKTAEPPQRPPTPPQPKPEPPAWVPGPDGQPRCRRHGHLPSAPADCTGCHDATIAAGKSA